MGAGCVQGGATGPAVIWTWVPPGPPEVTRVEAGLRAEPYCTGWNRALSRRVQPACFEIPLCGAPPKVVTVPIRRPAVRVRSFVFPAPLELAEGPGDGRPSVLRAAAARGPGGASVTRIAPPAEVIKLEDRLHYLLQPPLETLLSSHNLGFPRPPFAYQLAGIAFLYPRYSAVLADEMGLGKTMQAVTAARLLVHAGEVRSLLLVCP